MSKHTRARATHTHACMHAYLNLVKRSWMVTGSLATGLSALFFLGGNVFYAFMSVCGYVGRVSGWVYAYAGVYAHVYAYAGVYAHINTCVCVAPTSMCVYINTLILAQNLLRAADFGLKPAESC